MAEEKNNAQNENFVEYNFGELNKFDNVRFLDNFRDGIIDVYGQYVTGYIDIEEKKFYLERECTLPVKFDFDLEQLYRIVTSYISKIKHTGNTLTLRALTKDIDIHLTFEEVAAFIKEWALVARKLEELENDEEENEIKELETV